MDIDISIWIENDHTRERGQKEYKIEKYYGIALDVKEDTNVCMVIVHI